MVSPDKAEELSNNNVFDEMLSEYFIDKRKHVKSAKSLLSHMDEHFNVDKYTPRGLRTGRALGQTETGFRTASAARAALTER